MAGIPHSPEFTTDPELNGRLKHTHKAVARRRLNVSRLLAQGFPVVAVAKKLGVHRATVAEDKKWLLAQNSAQRAAFELTSTVDLLKGATPSVELSNHPALPQFFIAAITPVVARVSKSLPLLSDMNLPGRFGILPDFRSCIYFLIKKGAVVYIGQSKRLIGRVANHFNNKDFDLTIFLPVPPSVRLVAEGAFIRLLKPTMNGGGLDPLSPTDTSLLSSLLGISQEKVREIDIRTTAIPAKHLSPEKLRAAKLLLQDGMAPELVAKTLRISSRAVSEIDVNTTTDTSSVEPEKSGGSC